MNKYITLILAIFISNIAYTQETNLEFFRTQLDQKKIQTIVSSNQSLKASEELKQNRTESSIQFSLGQNKRAEVVSAGPMNYKENNIWNLTHNEFISYSTKSNYTHSSPFNDVKLFVGNSENSVLLQTKELSELKFGLDRSMYITDNNEIVSEAKALENASFDLIKLKGEPTLLYKNIFHEIDSRYKRLSDGFKQEYVIKSSDALLNNFSELIFSEKIVLPNGFFIEKELNGEQENLVIISSNRSQQISLSPILIYDNKYDKTYGKYKLENLGNNEFEISYIVSSAWVLDSLRSFPIVVDPTVTVETTNSSWFTGTVDEDGGSINPDYCTSGSMLVGFEDGGTGNDNYHSTVRFDVDIIPDNACVYNASLNLHQRFFENERNDDNYLEFTVGTSTADPITASCTDIYNAIQNGTKFEAWDVWGNTWAGPAGSIGNNDYNENSNGWKSFLNYGSNTSAENYDSYVQSSLTNVNGLIFGLDFYSEADKDANDIGFDFSCFCTHDNNEWIEFSGYNANERPYIIIEYDQPITITQQPTGDTKCEQESMTFITTASGGGAYNYQWQYDDGSGFSNIATNSTSSNYTIASLATSDAGDYRCVISNFCGTVTSSSATLIVDTLSTAPTGITGATTICNGNNTILTVDGGSLGTGASWEWYTGTCSNVGTNFSSGPSINVSPTVNTTYFVRAEGDCNTTSCVSVNVIVSPTPVAPVAGDVTVCENFPVILTATGTGDTLKWYLSSNSTAVLNIGDTFNLGILSAGNYLRYVTETSINGCESSRKEVQITVKPIPSDAPFVADATICPGASASLIATNPNTASLPATNFNWYADNSLSSIIYTGAVYNTPSLVAPPTSYAYYVEGTLDGCSGDTSSVTIDFYTAPSPIASNDTSICNGENAILTASAVGSTELRWYSNSDLTGYIQNGSSFTTPNLSSNTTYYVTAVYSNGCESQAEPVVVTINPLAQSPVLQDNDYCTSEAVILNASNINGTITWYSDAALTTNLGTGAPLNIGTQAAGTYNYFAQVNNGTCNSTVEGNTIEVFAIPSAPIVNPATICEGEQANLTITSATNTNWYSDAAMTNLLFVGSTFTTPVLNTNTTYYVTNEDVNGCESTSSSVLVTVISKPNAPNAINDTICKNQAATLTATGSGGALIWYADITLNNQVGTGNSFTTPSLNTSTTYYVVENNGTCIGDASPVSAIINSDITITIDLINNVSCFGGNDGDIYTSITGGNGVYTYSWTGGGANEDLINVAAGIYVLTVTDGIGCSKSASATIGSPSDIDIALDNLENVSCNGLSDGSIAISVSGGAAGYTYSWSDGAAVVATTNDLNNVAAGSYTLTVTDTKLCTETYTASITENVALAGNITANNILCYGATSSASVAVSGGALPYTYLWSNFDNGTTATNLPAGSVSVVVTDDNQCTLQLFANITAPSAALEVTDSLINNVTCFNGNDGAIYTSISGGTAPYSVSWSPNVGAAKDITNLAVGIYTITVTDANNCTTTATYEVENALEIISTMAVTNPSCFGEETGMIVVGNSGGTAPYNYSWNTTPPQTGLVAIKLAGDMTYTVTITDINGCTAQNTASVVYPTEMTVTSIPTSVSCISTANGSVTVAVQNGNRPYQYELNGFLQSDSVFDNLDGGNYVVFVEDNNNCTASATFDINTVSGVEAELEGAGNDLQYFTDNLYIVRGEEVSLNVNLINDVGNPIVGYSWTPSSIDTSSSESTPSFFPDDNVVVTIEVLEDINGSICSVFDTLYIDVSQESVAFVPTAFSPNNNGANNFFEMNVLGAENLNVQIFNRWGEVVFSNPTQGNGPSNINDASLMDGTNPRGAWDGKFNGEDVPTGAYAYKIEVTYFDGTVEVISGSVTVIR